MADYWDTVDQGAPSAPAAVNDSTPTVTVTAPSTSTDYWTNIDKGAPVSKVQEERGQTADTVMPNVRRFLAPEPGYTYAPTWVPLKRNDTTGELSGAMPNLLRTFSNGVLDLAEGPTTGTVTPEGTAALTTLMTMKPGTFGAPIGNAAREAGAQSVMDAQAFKELSVDGLLSKQFKDAPFTQGAPTAATAAGETSPTGLSALKIETPPSADVSSAGTQSIAKMLVDKFADHVVGAGIGAYVSHSMGFGPDIGALAGYVLQPVVKDLVKNYGRATAEAVVQAVKQQMTIRGMVSGPVGNPLLYQYQQQSRPTQQNKLDQMYQQNQPNQYDRRPFA